jgi:hypothetical protein
VAQTETRSVSAWPVGYAFIDYLSLGGLVTSVPYPRSTSNGFHEKTSLVKANVVTEASTIQDKTPFRYASIRTPFEPALQWLSA